MVLADSEPMPARLVRGFIAIAFTASVPADQSCHRRADTVKGGELSYMALAMEREQTAYCSLLMVAGTVLAGPERILARLEAAVSPWPSLLVHPHATTALLADTVKGGELRYTTLAMERERNACS